MKKHKAAVAAAIGVVASALGFSLWASDSSGTWISPAELNARIAEDSVLVLDVRTPQEFAAGHVPGAHNIPYNDVDDRIAEIRRLVGDRQLVLYCRSGRRAGIAARTLEREGLGPLLHLDGQLGGWRAAGLPVEL